MLTRKMGWIGTAVLCVVALHTSLAGAASYTWDTSTSSGIQTGSGTWGASSFWTTSGTSLAAWSGTTNNAVFDGASGSYAITVSGTQSANSVTFSTYGYTLSGGNVSIGAGGIVCSATAGTNTINSGIALTSNQAWSVGSGTQLAVGGTISGSGFVLSKTGAGTLALSGSNSYTGGTTISQGTISFANGALSTTGNITMQWNSTLQWASGNTQDISSRLVLYGNASLDTNGNTVTLGSGFGGVGALIKTGTGTLILTGSNTYTGGTTIGSGTLKLGGANAIANSNMITIQSGATLDMDGYSQTIQGLSGSGTIDKSSTGSHTLTISNTGTNTFSGVIQNSSGSLALTKTGAGILTLSGSNSYNGGTSIIAGILQFSKTSAMSSSGTVAVQTGATLAVNAGGTGEWTNGTTGAGTIGGLIAGTGGQGNTVTYSGNSTLGIDTTNAAGGTLTYSGIIPNKGTTLGLNKLGAGTLALTGSNSYTGGTTIGQGTLSFAYGALSSTGNITMNGGTLQWASGNTQDISSRLVLVNSKTASFDTNGNTVTLGSGFGSGTSGALIKTGTGTLILTGSNTYSGATTINQGALNFANDALGTTGNITMNGGTLQWASGNTQDISSRLVLVDSKTASFDTNGNTVTLGSGFGDANSAALLKTGAGTLTLSASYTGGTTIGSGTLKLGGVNAITYSNMITIQSGATLDMDGYSQAIKGLSGNGTIDKSSTGSHTLTISNTGTNTFSGVIQNSSGSLALTKTGAGTLTLSGSNTYTGGTTINSGTLSFANGSLGSTGNITMNGGTLQWATGNTQDISSRLTLVSGKTAYFNVGSNANVTLASGFGGGTTAALNVVGSTTGGTLTLAGSNNFTGNVTVTNGGLIITKAAALGDLTSSRTVTLVTASPNVPYLGLDGSGGNISLPSNISFTTSQEGQPLGAIVNIAGSNTINGNFSLTSGGGGTRFFTYAGSTLNLAGNLTVILAAGGLRNVYLSGSGTGIVSGVVADGGGFANQITKEGPSTWSLTNANTYTGLTIIKGGTLIANTIADTVGSSIGLSTSANAVTFDTGGGSLQFTGASGDTQRAFLFTGSGTLDVASGSTLTLGATGAASTTSGAWTGSGGVTKTGAGTLTIRDNSMLGSRTGNIVFSASNGGVFTMQSGTLNLAPQGATGQSHVIIGESGTGVFNQTGGTTIFSPANGSNTNSVYVGITSTGTLNVTGGTFTVDGVQAGGLQVARSATGVVTIGCGAGTALVDTPFMNFGVSTPGVGTLNLLTNGTLLTSKLSVSSGTNNLNFDGGTLQVKDATYASTFLTGFTGAVINSNGLTLDTNGSSVTVAQAMSGAGGLTKAGAGTLGLSGSNSYTGGTVINSGTVTVTNSQALGTGNITIVGSTDDPDNGSSLNINGVTVSGLTLTATQGAGNGYRAKLMGSGTNPGWAGAININNITAGSNSLEIFTNTSSGYFNVSGTITSTNNPAWALRGSGTGYLNGQIIGLGKLNKCGASTWYVNTTGNTWGDTVVSSGTLVLGADNALPTTTALTVGEQFTYSPGTCNLNGFNQTVTGIQDAYIGSSITNSATTASTLIVNNSADNTYGTNGGTVAGNLVLAKTGAGTLVLTSSNSYTGGTTIGQGTITSGNVNSLGTGATSVLDAGMLDLGGVGVNVKNLTGSGTIDNLVGGGTYILTANNTTPSVFSGIVKNTSGTVALIKTGTGTLTLNGANTYTGATILDNGTLAFGQDQPLTVSNITFGATAGSTNTSTLDLQTAPSSLSANALRVQTNTAASNTITIGNGKTLTISGIGGLTLGLDDGATPTYSNLTVAGAGSLVVANPSANVTVGVVQASNNSGSEGILDLSNLGSVTLGSGATPINELRVSYGQLNGGTLLLSNTANTITATTIQIGNSNDANASDHCGIVILGAGTNVIASDTLNIGLSKGSGTLQFASQAAGSSGAVTIGGKTGTAVDITIGSKNGTSTGASTNGTLDLRGHTATVTADALVIGKEDGATSGGSPWGALYFDAGTFTANSIDMANKSTACNTTASASLNIGGGVFTVNSGSGNFFRLGTQTGSGTANGILNVTGGTLNSNVDITDGGGSATTALSLNGGTLNMLGHNIGSDVNPIDNLNFQTGTLMNVGAINGTGGLTKNTAGILTISGTNTYTGATTISAGTLQIGSASALVNSGTISISGSGILDVNGYSATIKDLVGNGTIDNLSGNNTYALTINSNSTDTFSGNIQNSAGTLALMKTGGGTLILTGSNSYSGGTTISAGTLQIGNGGMTGTLGTGDVTNDTSLVFNRSDSLEVANAISGIGTLTKTGAGTLILIGNNGYAGGTTLGGGVLQVSNNNALGTGSVTTSGTSCLQLNGVTISNPINLGASGGFFNASNIEATGGQASQMTGLITLGTASSIKISGSSQGDPNADNTTLRISGGVTGNNNLNLYAEANNSNITVDTTPINIGTATLAGKNLYINIASNTAGAVQSLWGGTLYLGVDNTFAGTPALTLGNANYAGVLDLQGHTQAFGSLTASTTGTNISSDIITSSVAMGTLIVSNTGTSQFGGRITGSLALTKSGSGTLILTATNSYSGGTTISAGALQFSKTSAMSSSGTVAVQTGATLAVNVGGTGEWTTGTSGAGTIGGLLSGTGGRGAPVTYSGNVTLGLDTANGGTQTYAGNIANVGTALTLNKMGTNTLILTGTNTYSGGTTVSAGTLQVGNGGTAGTLGTGGVTNNASLVFNRSNSLTVANTIGGTGSLTKSGSGTLILTATNSYSGGTTIGAGTLQFSKTAAMSSSGTVAVQAGATLAVNVGGTGEWTTGTSGAGTIGGLLSGTGGRGAPVTYSGNVTLGLDITNGAAQTYAGNIANVGTALTLNKMGTNTLILTGTNTYSGGTTIGAGTLQFSKTAAMSSSGTVAVQTGATLVVNVGGTGEWTTGASGAGTLGGLLSGIGGRGAPVTYSGNVTLGLDTTNGGTQTYAGNIANVGTALALTKLGTNTLILTGTNTYSGGTNISAGALQVGNGGITGSLGTGSIANSSTIVFSRTDNYGGAFANSISGAGVLTLSSGTLTLSGTNTYTGGTTINSGTLKLGGANAIANSNMITIQSGATLDMDGYSQTIKGLSGSGTIDKSSTGNNTLTVNNATANTFSGVIQNSSGSLALTKTGAGILTLAGSNSYNGNTTVSTNSVLKLGASDQIPNGTGKGNVSLWGTLNLNGFSDTINGLSGAGVVDNIAGGGASVLTVGDYNQSSTFSGTIKNTTGTVSLVKTGAGTLGLSGSNGYTGATTISSGILKIGNNSALANSSSITVAGTLDVAGYTATIKELGGAGTINNSTGTGTLVINNNGVDTFDGLIQNSGGTLALTKTGAGTLTLLGSNAYTGATIISAGILNVQNGSALGSGTVNIAGSNTSQLQLAGGITVSNSISLSGTNSSLATILSASGTNTVSGLFTNPGGNAITFQSEAGSLLNLTGTINTGATAHSVNYSGNGDIAVSNAASYYNLFKTGTGTLTLGGNNSFSASPNGYVNIQGGTLKVNNANALTNSSTVAITDGATLDLNGFNQSIKNLTGSTGTPIIDNTSGSAVTLTISNTAAGTFAGVIRSSGPGGSLAISKSGAATLTLAGANIYNGMTTVSGGLISLGAAETAGISGPLGNPTTLANSIVLQGGGLQFTASNTYDYTTSGRLQLADGSTGTIDTNGQTVLFANAIGVGDAQTGALTKAGAGTLILAANNTFTGNVSFETATVLATPSVLVIKNSSALGTGPKTVSITTFGRTLALDGSGGDLTLASEISFITSNYGGAAWNGNPASAPIINVAGNNFINGSITMTAGGGGTKIQSDAGTLTLAGNITASTTGRTLEFAGSGNILVSGVIGDGAGSYPVTKTGAGTLTLAGSNSYSGGTIINGGSLIAGSNNALGSGNVTISSGALQISSGMNPANIVQMTGTSATYRKIFDNGAQFSNYDNSSQLGSIDTNLSLSGTILVGSATISNTWRKAVAGEAPFGLNLISDVATISGCDNRLLLIELSYDPSAINTGIPGHDLQWLIDHKGLFVGTEDGGNWINATLLDHGLNMGGYLGNHVFNPDTDLVLGNWGVDVAHNIAWAVIDHNSDFAVVPEPGTLALLALGGVALLRRRRQK